MTAVAAIDLGATSGRVMVGQVGPDQLVLRQVARFDNGPIREPDGLHWATRSLYTHALGGLRAAAAWDSAIASVGVDSWAVDYALLQGNEVVGEPFHYRDERTARGVERVHAKVPFADLYARNGLQFLPFTTLYQLASETVALDEETSALLIPDLIGFYLTGQRVAEITNASTTGLLNVETRQWDGELMRRLGLPTTLLPPLVEPGAVVGPILDTVVDATGLAAGTPVIAVGSHDTASAVVGTPMVEPGGAFISCGTWGLVGVEIEHPVLTAQAREANFTNEGGVDGRTRFLHNVMGLWLLSESIREWELDGTRIDLERLLAEAAAISGPVAVFDTNDARFLAPGNMPERIAQWCAEFGQPVPRSKSEFARSIIESLATAFAAAVRAASALSGTEVLRIHMVGGGALNELLCQRTADLAGLPVIAGPVEATAIGNVLIQGRAIGATSDTLESLRDLVRRTFAPRLYEPRGYERHGALR